MKGLLVLIFGLVLATAACGLVVSMLISARPQPHTTVPVVRLTPCQCATVNGTMCDWRER